MSGAVDTQGKITALIVAAGKGTRMGTAVSKQFLPVGGVPLLVRTLQAFEQAPTIDEIVLVVSAQDVERCEQYGAQFALGKLRRIVAGGGERQQSVHLGLQACTPDTAYVLIHDGVRPFVDNAMLQRLLDGLLIARHHALTAAVRVKDTIKQTSTAESTTISDTLPRDRLWAIQTPQAFRLSTILAAHEQAERDGFVGTDDAVLVERVGQAVQLVEGDPLNIKLTTPDDLLLAEAILHVRQSNEIR